MSEYYAVVREGDSLKHYGVLGMRWGIRHDRRVQAAKAKYKTNRKAIKGDKSLSKDQKQRKIAASREQWMKERESAANRLYSLNSKEANRRVARMSSRKALGQATLMGSYGALKYNESRGRGQGRALSYVRGHNAGYMNSALAGVPAANEYLRNRAARPNKKKKK